MKTRIKNSNKKLTALLLAGVCGIALVSAGCGNDDAAAGDGDGGVPLYVAVSSVFNGDDVTSYVTALTSLEADQEIDYGSSIERGSIPRLYNDPSPRERFFLGEGEEPVLQRFNIVGSFPEAAERLSLLNFGVSNFDNAGYILSEDKAYYYDYATLQVIVWNPTAMEVLSTINVTGVERDGVEAYFAYSSPGRQGKYVFFNLQYYEGEPDYFPAAGSVLVVIDTETDSLAAVDIDERCDAVANWVRMDDGSVYFASGGAAIHNAFFDLGLTTGCMLKLAEDGLGFDDDYFVSMHDMIDSPIVGNIVNAGPNEVYVKALDENLLAVDDAEEVADFFTLLYRWYRVDLATMTATLDDRLPLTSSGNYFFDVDGATFADQYDDEAGRTTLWHMNATDGPEPAVTLRGYVYGLGRAR